MKKNFFVSVKNILDDCQKVIDKESPEINLRNVLDDLPDIEPPEIVRKIKAGHAGNVGENIIEECMKSPSKLNEPKSPVLEEEEVEEIIDESKLDSAWRHVFKTLSIEPGNIESMLVTNKQIKKAKSTYKGEAQQFEPRLMCYQNTSRPKIFVDNNLYLIALKNGIYLLTKVSIYKKINIIGGEPIYVQRNDNISVLEIGNSESSRIDNLYYAGVFNDILGERITAGPLLNGRHRCKFDMIFGGELKNVNGVQVEVDACYESENKILIVEAKNEQKNVNYFNIKQLYYPFRMIYDGIREPKKEIECIFMNTLDGITHIWKYKFENPKDFHSIQENGYYIYSLV